MWAGQSLQNPPKKLVPALSQVETQQGHPMKIPAPVWGRRFENYLGDFLEQEQLVSGSPLEQEGAAQGAGAALEEHQGAGAAATVPEGGSPRASRGAAPPEHSQGGGGGAALAAARFRLCGLAGGAP